MKVNILIDNPKSWFAQRAQALVQSIKTLKHTCTLCYSESVMKKADVSFFLSCERYISKQTRAKSSYNIVVHASDLPKGRGMSPATWHILEGKNTIPVTLFEVARDIDAGDYYLKDAVHLDGSELIDEWREKLFKCIKKNILDFLLHFPPKRPLPQQGKPTLYRRRTPKDSQLNIHGSIQSQFNLLRVVDNERYPAFFQYKRETYIIKIYKLPHA